MKVRKSLLNSALRARWSRRSCSSVSMPGILVPAPTPWACPCAAWSTGTSWPRSAEPLLHLLDLARLRQVHPLGEQRDLGPDGAVLHERGHPERLGVVMDHPLHEEDVGVDEARGIELRELVGRERLAALTGGSGLDDVRRCLGRGFFAFGLVPAAGEKERQAECDRAATPGTAPSRLRLERRIKHQYRIRPSTSLSDASAPWKPKHCNAAVVRGSAAAAGAGRGAGRRARAAAGDSAGEGRQPLTRLHRTAVRPSWP